MLFNIVADIAKLSLFIVCAYALLGAYARRRRPQWAEHLTKRRLSVLGALTLAVGGIKLIEDVLAKESGPVDEAMGWVEDYWTIDSAFKPLHDVLDHSHLNEIDGLDNPTSENIARWIWARLTPMLPGVSCVMVQETPDTGCAYRGE